LENNNKIVIIGCGAGGGTAAQFARKTDRKSQITVIEKDKFPQYSKCGLPYTISNKIPNVLDLIEFDKAWFEKSKIDLLLETEVENIDIKKKEIIAKKEGKKINKLFDKLIICTGSEPFVPPIKNINQKGIFVVRTINDIKKISEFIKQNGSATIIGAGLIGLEIADNLKEKNMKVTIIEALTSILPNVLDQDMAKQVYNELPKDLLILTNHIATEVESRNGKINKLIVKDLDSKKEKKIDTDLLIIAAGTRPNTHIAEKIGCEIGKTGGIIVNNKCETSIKDVYAAGDCTEFLSFVTKKPCLVGLGSVVVRQAIAAGTNAAGKGYELPKGVLNTFTSDFFGLEIAGVGANSSLLEDQNIVTAKFNGFSLPPYFPGGKPISIKILVDEKTKKIVGAQAFGKNVALRINTFACAILGGMDVETFRKLETAYAPPIAPTLDVVTLVCDIVSKKLKRK
jgi:NADH oxidase (H2O2-forming)